MEEKDVNNNTNRIHSQFSFIKILILIFLYSLFLTYIFILSLYLNNRNASNKIKTMDWIIKYVLNEVKNNWHGNPTRKVIKKVVRKPEINIFPNVFSYLNTDNIKSPDK